MALLESFRRYLRMRRLRPVVAVLPFLLARRYGDCEFYTIGQAQRALTEIKVGPELVGHALAVTLAEDDAIAVAPKLTSERYHALRAEIAEVFDLEDADFTTKDLRANSRLRALSKGMVLSDDKQGTLWGGTPYRAEDIAHMREPGSHD